MVTDIAAGSSSGGVELIAGVETSTCVAGVGVTGSADRAGGLVGAWAGVLAAGPSAGGAGSAAGRPVSLTEVRSVGAVGADEIAAAGATDLLRRDGGGVLSAVETATGRVFFPNSAPHSDRFAAGFAGAAIGASAAAARTLVW